MTTALSEDQTPSSRLSIASAKRYEKFGDGPRENAPLRQVCGRRFAIMPACLCAYFSAALISITPSASVASFHGVSIPGRWGDVTKRAPLNRYEGEAIFPKWMRVKDLTSYL